MTVTPVTSVAALPLLAATLAACAIGLAVGPVTWSPRLRGSETVQPDGSRGPVRLTLLAALVSIGAVLTVGLVGGRRVVLGGIVGAVALAGLALWRRRLAAGRAERMSARVLEACEALAADLAAGQPPRSCLERVGRDFVELAPLAGAARLGADVPLALRHLALTPGAQDLRLVAAAWQVAERSGASLAPALTRVADGLRDSRRTARVVRAELASAWAATRLMAALPVFFCLAGSSLGADPWGFLTGTTPGLVCLATGLTATVAGVAWLQRIAAAVESA